jgi:hypothetical protein
MSFTPTPVSGGSSDFVFTLGMFVILGIIFAGFLVYLIYLKEIKPHNNESTSPPGKEPRDQ